MCSWKTKNCFRITRKFWSETLDSHPSARRWISENCTVELRLWDPHIQQIKSVKCLIPISQRKYSWFDRPEAFHWKCMNSPRDLHQNRATWFRHYRFYSMYSTGVRFDSRPWHLLSRLRFFVVFGFPLRPYKSSYNLTICSQLPRASLNKS
jgi:hypothetical protein